MEAIFLARMITAPEATVRRDTSDVTSRSCQTADTGKLIALDGPWQTLGRSFFSFQMLLVKPDSQRAIFLPSF